MIFNGPDKSEEALEKAIKDGAKIHIDHFDELYQTIELTGRLKSKANVAIRVNMDTGVYPKWDRFGFNFENGEAKEALKRIIANPNLNLIGLHTHIGTYMMSAEAYKIAASKLVSLLLDLKTQHNKKIQYIDIGGGFPSNNTLKGQYLSAEQVLPSIEEFADAITSQIFTLNSSPDELPTLILETGRAMIDDAGYLLSTVLANKRLSDGRRAVVIDAGVNTLFTSFWYKHKIAPAEENGGFTENVSIYGPLCMNIDVIREEIVLPTLKKGDQIVIFYVGAYNVTQWMQFITLRPNVVMVMEDGTVEVIREAETLDYVTRNEKIPSKLTKFSL
ncbi:alanine racemase [Bacteroidota bacterium]